MDGGHLLGGRYRVVERLGTGGMSVVWRGRDEVLGRQVAVKMLATRLASDNSFRERIHVEARAAAQLCHPHITNVYDYGESTGEDGLAVPYVVMELVEGESLSARLGQAGALPWRDAATISAQVAAGLATAHARGVVHRDITPGNIMLTATGVKVVDFGISALAGEADLDAYGNILGTPAYLAPERLDGRPVEPASDVYALGVVLYRALTGRLPWIAGSTDDMLLAHLKAPPEPLPPIEGLPSELAELCMRCLAKLPEERPTSADVARDLAAAVGMPVPLPPAAEPAASAALTRRVPAALISGSTTMPVRPEAVNEETLTGLVARSQQARVWFTALLPHSGLARVRGSLSPAPRRIKERVRGMTLVAATIILMLTAVGWAQTVQADSGSLIPEGGQALAFNLGDRSGCKVQYQVRRDWGTGFTAALTVTNTGKSPVDGWRLTFAFPGQQRITSGRAAQWTQSGSDVTAHPADRDGWLDAGGSVTFDLTGSYRGENPLPLEFAMDGRSCVALVAGTPGTVPKPVTTQTSEPADSSGPGPAAASDKDKGKGKGKG